MEYFQNFILMIADLNFKILNWIPISLDCTIVWKRNNIFSLFIYKICYRYLSLENNALRDKVFQWFATGLWFSLDTPVSSTNKTDRHDITEILLIESAVKYHNPNLPENDGI
jgi:hypothetical protein